MALKLPSRRSGVQDAIPLDTSSNEPAVWLLRLLPSWLRPLGTEVDQHIREGRFQRSLSLIAGLSSVLSGLEVAYEHYRGSYSQRIMFSPVILSPLLLVAGVWGAFSRKAARTVLPLVSVATIVDGVVGFIFHVRGVQRKPGGWRVPVANVIMGPPVFAPLLFAISGYLGVIAAMLRREDDPRPLAPALTSRPRSPWLRLLPGGAEAAASTVEQEVREGRFQRGLAAAAALSAFFSGVEALYSHYKNNFQFRVQWTPLALTPVLMVAGFGAVWSRKVARTLLPIASILAILDGGIGTLYHARGVLRRTGGMTKPFYNVIYGAPIFAPLLFAASGFMGLLASLLRRSD